jgi:hypothetical protein
VDLSDVGGREGGGTDMSGFQGFCFGGLPPLAPFARAAAVLASDVTRPPLRPKATAAGFLRGMGFVPAVDVLLRQGLDAFHWQGGDLARQFVEARDVSGFQRGVAFGHQVAAVRVHARNLPNRLGFVKWGIC